MSSQAYPDRESCTDGIQATIQALGNRSSYDVRDDNSIALRSSSNDILVQSDPLPSNQDPSEVIGNMIEDALNTSEFDVSFTSTSRRRSQVQVPKKLSLAEFATLYNFLRQSVSGQQGFELFRAEDNEQYYFHFNDANGQALLFSRGFSTAGQRDRRLESVIKSAPKENRFELLEDNGQHFFILKARNGQEIARSRMFSSVSEAESAALFVREQAPSYADQYIKKRTKRNTSGTDDYLFAVPSPTNMPGFDTFRNPDTKRHYFHLNDNEGNPVLYSQGYTSGRGRDNGIRSVIRNSVTPASFISSDNEGNYFFAIQAANRQEIARSRSFASAEERDRMIAFLLTWIRQFATAYGVTLESETSSTETFTLAGIQPTSDDTIVSDDPSAGDTAIIAGLAATGAALGAQDDEETASDTEDLDADDPSTGDTVVAGLSSASSGPEAADDIEEDASGEAEQTSDESASVGSRGLSAGGDGAVLEAEPASPSAENNRDQIEEEEEEEPVYATADDDSGGFRLRLPWIIPLIILLLLLLFLMRGCMGCIDLPQQGVADSGDADQEEVVADNTSADATADGVTIEGSGSSGIAGNEETGEAESTDAQTEGGIDASQAASAAETESPDTGSTRTILGPNAQVLGFAPGSLEAQIADLLSNAERALPQTFVMDQVAFPSNSAKLNKGAYNQVDNLVKVLQAYPDIIFEFQGHIDGTEDDNSARAFMNGENITLSAVRARCLVKKFEEQSIDSSQLDFTGFGASNPVANNTTESNRQKNRRLELVIKMK